MNFCTLRPPNDRFLSDDIIISVMQRRESSRVFPTDDYSSKQTRQPRQSFIPPQSAPMQRQVSRTYSTYENVVIPERDAIALVGLLSLMSGTKRKRAESPIFSSLNAHYVAPEAAKSQPETDTESLNSEKQESIVAKWQEGHQDAVHIEKQVDHIQDDRISHLNKQTRKLREEIEEFEHRRRVIALALPAQKNGWDVVIDYFRLFQYGLQSKGRSSVIKHTDAQLDFLRRTMSSDVVLNTGQGPDAMLRSWRCMSLWFQDVNVELEGLDRSAVGSLVAVTRTSVTITERTLRNVFPHLCSKNGTISELVQKLLGARIVMRGLTRFEWDSATRCVTSVVARSDLLTALLHLLGNVEDVARVFARSSISPDFQWRSMIQAN